MVIHMGDLPCARFSHSHINHGFLFHVGFFFKQTDGKKLRFDTALSQIFYCNFLFFIFYLFFILRLLYTTATIASLH